MEPVTKSYLIMKEREPTGSYKESLKPLTYPESFDYLTPYTNLIVERRDLTEEEAIEVADRDHILKVELDDKIYSADTITMSNTIAYHKMNVLADMGMVGQGQVIGILDTGLSTIWAARKANKIVAAQNFSTAADWKDDVNGHGTWIMGCIEAVCRSVGRWGTGEYLGELPSPTYIHARVLNDSGNIDGAGIMAGVDFAVGSGATVLNFSLSSRPGSPSSVLCTAIDNYFNNYGVISVCAAGNTQDGTSTFYADTNQPACANTAISVGNIDENLVLNPSSAWGNTVDCVAMGTSISYGWNENGSYETGSSTGTSMSCPHVAATVAMLRSHGHSPEKVVTALLEGCIDLGMESYKQGHGAINALNSWKILQTL